MKKLIIIILLFFSIKAFSQIKNGKHDQDLHFLAGTAISGTAFYFYDNEVFKGKNKVLSFLSSVATSFVFSYGIETLDASRPNGVFNWRDIKNTVYGGALGGLASFTISINKKLSKKEKQFKKANIKP